MTKSIKLSATRVSTFLRCKRKYWFQYEEHIPKLSNPSFKLGLACHEALELAGNIWLTKGRFGKEDLEKIFTLYDEISIREGIEFMEVHREGKELVQSRLSSFSLGNQIISLEKKFGFLDGAHPDFKTKYGVPLIGAMDKVVELDNESLIIVDYKTSKTSPTPEQLKDDLQLSLYDLVGSMLWPQYDRIILCLDMLKSDPVYTYRTPQQREDFDKYLLTVYNTMISLDKKDALPSLNIFCPWCDYKEYCEKYIEACTKSQYEFLPSSKLSNEQLISEYDTISETVKILETRKRDIGMLIMEKIKMSGENLKGDNKQIYVRQSSRSNYDIKVVQSVVEPVDFVELVSLNKKAVDDYCSRHPQAKKKIEESSTTNYTTPFLASKKI